MFSCNCLNIIIDVENDFETINWDLLELSDEEKLDRFFKQDIVKVQTLLKINKTYPSLVQVRKVGSWNINYCINCDVHTHAVHKEKGASFVLIYAKLLNSDAIKNIKSSNLYSTIFNIVVNPNEIAYDGEVIDTYRNKDAAKIIKNINEVVSNYIRKEHALVEERINKFRDEQYDILSGLKDRAYKESEALVRVVHSALSKSDSNTNIEKLNFQSPKKSLALGDSVKNTSSVPGSPSSISHSPKRQKSSIVQPRNPSKDDGLIFDFEHSECISSVQNTDRDFELDLDVEGDSDTEFVDDNDIDEDDDDDVGISFNASNRMKNSPSIAKSLPVNIPAFVYSRSRGQAIADDVDDLPPEENVDIAASIKALAKSVHGDAIFGELPRPRFSTQL